MNTELFHAVPVTLPLDEHEQRVAMADIQDREMLDAVTSAQRQGLTVIRVKFEWVHSDTDPAQAWCRVDMTTDESDGEEITAAELHEVALSMAPDRIHDAVRDHVHHGGDCREAVRGWVHDCADNLTSSGETVGHYTKVAASIATRRALVSHISGEA